MRHAILFALPVLLVTTACGGGGGTPTSPSSSTPPGTSTPNPNGSMSFKVDGDALTATSITATLANGILSIGGTIPSRNTTFSFAVTPTATGTGTYALGPLSSANALVLIGNPAAGWQAGVGIGSGTITLNTLTSTAASGTFAFNLVAVAGSGATGTKAITEGVFNVTFTTPAPPPANPNTGSAVSALVDGVPWSGSLSRRATLTNNFLTVTGQDTNFRVITLVVPVSSSLQVPPSAPPVISLTFGAMPQGVVTMVLGAQNWDNGRAGGEGTFTLTSISTTRVTGTFTVTVVSNPLNPAPLPTVRITNGQFDMALERF